MKLYRTKTKLTIIKVRNTSMPRLSIEESMALSPPTIIEITLLLRTETIIPMMVKEVLLWNEIEAWSSATSPVRASSWCIPHSFRIKRSKHSYCSRMLLSRIFFISGEAAITQAQGIRPRATIRNGITRLYPVEMICREISKQPKKKNRTHRTRHPTSKTNRAKHKTSNIWKKIPTMEKWCLSLQISCHLLLPSLLTYFLFHRRAILSAVFKVVFLPYFSG